MSDGSGSLTKSLRTTKVNTGYANNAYSDVRQNIANATCHARAAQDEYGRPVDYNTLVTTSEMCPHSALFRIEVESAQRPAYGTYGNVDGIRGDYNDSDFHFDTDLAYRNSANHGRYDTAGLGRDQSFGLNARSQMPRNTYGDSQDFYRNQELYRKYMLSRYQSTRFKASGMN